MSFEDFKIITTDNAGSTLRYGGNDFKEIMQMLNGAVLSNRRPRIATPWQWLNNTLYLMNPANTFSYTFETSAITADRKIIIPALAGDATLVLDNAANIFTSTTGQEMRAIAAELLKLYRPEAGLTDIDISYYWNDSLGNKTRYAVLRSTPTNVTDGSETARFDIYLLTNGTFIRNLRLLNNGDLTILTGASTGYAFLGTGLTAIRNFTFPNLSGTISTAEVNETVTGIKTWKAANVSSKANQAGVSELIQSWTVDDSAGASKVELLNASATNAVFAPWIRAYNLDNSADPALYFYGYIGNALDSGTQAAIRFDVRKADNSAIATRPLFSFRSAGTEMFQINQTSFLFANKILSNIGRIEQNVPATAGTAEVLHQWKVSDDASSLIEIINNTSADGQFLPLIQSTNSLTNASFAGLYIYSRIPSAQDTGLVPVMIFDSRTTSATALTTRPIFQFRNGATNVFQINAKGDLISTIIAQSGIPEQIAEFKVADANSFLRILNSSATNARFVPLIRGRQIEDATLSGLALEGRVEVAHDTGAAPCMIIQAIRQDDTLVTTRPLIHFRNQSSLVFAINPESFDFTDRPLLNTRGTADLPIAEGNQSRRHGTVEAPALTATGHILAGTWSSYGTHAGSSDSAEGSRDITSTGTTLGTAAGWKCSSVHFARRSYNPKLLTKFALQQITNQRFFFGLLGTGATIGNTDDPVGTNAAFLFGVITTNANFVIIHNVASGATPTVVDTGIPVDTALRTIEIEADNSLGWRWRMSTTSTLGTWSAYINTNVPSSSSSLACHYHLINSAAEDKIVHHFITSYQSKK